MLLRYFLVISCPTDQTGYVKALSVQCEEHTNTYTHQILKSRTVHGISNVVDDFVFELSVVVRTLTLIARWFPVSTRAGNVNTRVLNRSTNRGGGFNDFVFGDVARTVPPRDRAIRSPTWSVSLPRIQLISPESWSNMSPGEDFLCHPLPKRGQNCDTPPSPPIRSPTLLLAKNALSCFLYNNNCNHDMHRWPKEGSTCSSNASCRIYVVALGIFE